MKNVKEDFNRGNMWSIHIYSVFYIILHFAFTIFELVYVVFDYVYNKSVDFCHEFLLVTEKNNYLQTRSQETRKTPVHLTVILGSEPPSYKDLANLVFWCLATRISFISFYDQKGILKKNQHELKYAVSQRQLKEDRIIWHSHSDFMHKNGFIGKKIHVKILTEEDGRQSVVNLTKDYSETKNIDINADKISQDLHKQFEFPDPDLGLVCGRTCSLHNYPPWQARVTEFLHIKSHHNITSHFFLKQLLRYSKCEQRLGK